MSTSSYRLRQPSANNQQPGKLTSTKTGRVYPFFNKKAGKHQDGPTIQEQLARMASDDRAAEAAEQARGQIAAPPPLTRAELVASVQSLKRPEADPITSLESRRSELTAKLSAVSTSEAEKSRIRRRLEQIDSSITQRVLKQEIAAERQAAEAAAAPAVMQAEKLKDELVFASVPPAIVAAQTESANQLLADSDVPSYLAREDAVRQSVRDYRQSEIAELRATIEKQTSDLVQRQAAFDTTNDPSPEQPNQ